MDADPPKHAINRAYRFVEAQQQALDDREITEAQWFESHKQFFSAHYLASGDPRGQSGHSGGEVRYRYTRMLVLEAIHRSGTFLDVGCANGYLIESLHRWLSGSGLRVVFHGLDISEGLHNLARRRLPHWQERFFLGNALHWTPETPFDYVCTAELGYVPRDREHALVDHLFADCVAPGGRLIVGPYGEETESSKVEEKLRAWGYAPAGFCVKSHHSHPALAKKLLWFDKE